MNEPTEIKYSLDENGEPYYAATHTQAVQGMETVETNIEDLMNFKETVIGDTGWVDFQFIPEVDKNTRFGEGDFKCGLKEVRFGDIRIKSIRLNIGNIPHTINKSHIFPQVLLQKTTSSIAPQMAPSFCQLELKHELTVN